MKKAEWNEGLNHMDPVLVETYIAQKDALRQKSKQPKRLWLRLGAIAACFLLIVSTAIIALKLQDKPIKLTGKQEIVYGESWVGGLYSASYLTPGFYIDTVVQANVIEVLPDYYYMPDSTYRYLIARLSVVDAIRGDGLPDELLLRFPYYTADIFDGYDTFIFSLNQVGVENYMLINDTTREVTYFPHMFSVTVGDLGYGSVVAFNDGKVDASFFDKTGHRLQMLRLKKSLLEKLEDPSAHSYPVGYDTTLEEAKANIKTLVQNSDSESIYVNNRQYDYVTTDDIFITDEQKQLMAYLAPSKNSVFLQRVTCYADRVVASYTRVVNGFLTDEEIVFNGYYAGLYGHDAENGNIHISEAAYNEKDLKKMPKLGKILANMDLSELLPPHIEITDEMQFVSSRATGIYRKVEDQVYGVIQVQWSYDRFYPDGRNAPPVMDRCYYLCDQEGSCSFVEVDQLEELFHDKWFILQFPEW